ncbi:hypothetical protein LG634_20865 [Streptomyces bambusae]|uniref:hypothetical protein n=1 Tax=Streptomyces bambusae TaxID=1550616 RepID=UPI001CFEAE92|nr:hypothetical protein [Streptomyces bambusae]MCB5167282.1 hypothetical protein [Streptomyces bambusae]
MGERAGVGVEGERAVTTDFEGIGRGEPARMVGAADPGAVAGCAAQLVAAADALREIGEALRRHRVDGWEGEAAEAYEDRVRRMSAAALALSDYGRTGGEWLRHAAQTLGEVRAGLGATAGPAPEAEHAEAVRQMTKLAQSYAVAAEQMDGARAPVGLVSAPVSVPGPGPGPGPAGGGGCGGRGTASPRVGAYGVGSVGEAGGSAGPLSAGSVGQPGPVAAVPAAGPEHRPLPSRPGPPGPPGTPVTPVTPVTDQDAGLHLEGLHLDGLGTAPPTAPPDPSAPADGRPGGRASVPEPVPYGFPAPPHPYAPGPAARSSPDGADGPRYRAAPPRTPGIVGGRAVALAPPTAPALPTGLVIGAEPVSTAPTGDTFGPAQSGLPPGAVGAAFVPGVAPVAGAGVRALPGPARRAAHPPEPPEPGQTSRRVVPPVIE